MEILTGREADPQIRHAITNGEVIRDDVAHTIASWFPSLAAQSLGLGIEARELLTRVDQLITSEELQSSESLVDLHALRAWALDQIPHLMVVTYTISSQDWEQWSRQWGHAAGDRPEGIAPDTREVNLVADVAQNMGQWLYPGDHGYPENPELFDDYDRDDGGVWVPASRVDTVAAMLAGETTQFWAQSYGSNPFGPGVFWSSFDTFAAHGPGTAYVSRYEHPHTGEVEIKFARLIGFTEAQQEAVYHTWKERPAES